MISPIPIAVLGLGRAGWSIHVEQLRARADFQIIDVADPDARRRDEAARALGCPTHASLPSMLKVTKAEIVVVATPSFLHEADAILVLRSGRHCLVEKPMALSFAGARRMMAAAGRAKRKLFVHQNLRFSPEFLHLREILDSGVIGKVFEIRVAMLNFARRNDWQTLRKNGGGVLNNTCPHVIDMLLNLLDSPVTAVLGDLQHIKDAGDSEDHVHVFMKTKGGCVAEMTVSTACALPSPKWMLLGANGTVSSDGQQTKLRYYDPKKAPPLRVIDGPAPERRYGNDDVLTWQEETRPVQPLKQYGGFYDNVAAVLRHKAKMVVTPESAAENIRVIEWSRKGTKFPTIKAG